MFYKIKLNNYVENVINLDKVVMVQVEHKEASVKSNGILDSVATDDIKQIDIYMETINDMCKRYRITLAEEIKTFLDAYIEYIKNSSKTMPILSDNIETDTTPSTSVQTPIKTQNKANSKNKKQEEIETPIINPEF